MDLKTKFDINQRVYFFSGNKIVSGKVKNIRIIIDKIDKSKYIKKIDADYGIRLTYKTTCHNEWHEERDIFTDRTSAFEYFKKINRLNKLES